MPKYYFKKEGYLWIGRAKTADAAYRRCVREMNWHQDDIIFFAGKDLSEEEFDAFKWHYIWKSPVKRPPSKEYQPGFVDKEGKFFTKEDIERKYGFDPMNDLPVFPVPKKFPKR